MTTATELPILDRAWLQIPGYTDARDELEKHAGLVRSLAPGSVLSQEQIEQRFAAEAIAAGRVTLDMLREFADAQVLLAAAEPATGALNRAQAALVNRLELLKRRGADTALTWLNTELDTLMSTLRPLAEVLGDVTSADAAIKAGPKAIKAWVEAAELGERHTAIRDAQKEITASGYISGFAGSDNSAAAMFAAAEDVERFGIVRNAGDYPPIAAYTADKPRRVTRRGVGEFDDYGRTPWPSPQLGSIHLLWLVRNDIRNWVPTVRELKEVAASARTDRAAALNGDQPARTKPMTAAEQAAFDRRHKSLQDQHHHATVNDQLAAGQ